jgi:hypothetical protein
MAENGEAYGVFCLSRFPARERNLFLTGPVVKSAYSVYATLSSNLVYKTPEELADYTIGVYGPSGNPRSVELLTNGWRGKWYSRAAFSTERLSYSR